MYAEERNIQKLCWDIEAQTGTATATHSITKSNGRKFYEIAIGEDNPLTSPVIYVDEPFTTYWEQEDILQGILAMYRKCKSLERADSDYSIVKKHVHTRLANHEKNKGILKNIPHQRYLDLSLIPVLMLREILSENTFYAMRNIPLGMWRSTADELLQAACDNEKNNCMIEAIKFSAEELGFEAYAMSNGFHCAAIDRQSLRALSVEIQNESLYLIPSSVYEMLVIPEDNVFDIAELREFADRLNTSLESESAFLSDNIYRFNRKKSTLEIL